MAQTISSLPVGAKVVDPTSKFYGVPVVWKIADHDHDGENTATLVSEKILALHAFDAKEPKNTNAQRQQYGNNRYLSSNILQWLNSSAEPGKWYNARHGEDQAPNGSLYGINPYASEAGFLNGFSEDFRNALQSKGHITVKSTADGGGSEVVTSKIFLLSRTEVNLGNENNIAEGEAYPLFATAAERIARLTTMAVAHQDYVETGVVPDAPWAYSLRTAYSSGPHAVRDVTETGVLGTTLAYGGDVGVRPACVISSTQLVSDTPDADGVYTLLYKAAPTAVPDLSVPAEVTGGETVNISWGAATDTDDDLAGYEVDRQDGTGSWTPVYRGTQTEISTSIPFGVASVKFRVRAYDASGLYGPYAVSETRTIANRERPTVPGSLTVPAEIYAGRPVSILWGTSTDADDNLAGYVLERSLDSGEYQQVYQGPNQSFTDIIPKGSITVTYRVAAYDTYGAMSDYRTAAAHSVGSSWAPEIVTSQPADAGTVTEALAFQYTIANAYLESELTVSEYLDGNLTNTFTAGNDQTYDYVMTPAAFLQCTNGPHTVRIEVTDGDGIAAFQTTFIKEAVSCSVMLTEGIELDGPITVAAMSINGTIPVDAVLTAEMTNNFSRGEDGAVSETVIWEDATDALLSGANHVFTHSNGADNGVFNFRITIATGPSGLGGRITSIQGGIEQGLRRFGLSAGMVSYDNTGSALPAGNVQDAVDAAAETLDTVQVNLMATQEAVMLLQEAAIAGLSDNVLIEPFLDCNDVQILEGQFDSAGHRLYA